MTSPERGLAQVLSRHYDGEPPGASDLRDYAFRVSVRWPAGCFEATLHQRFSILELKPATGDVDVPVRIDRATRRVTFALAGDPRYDADALIARRAGPPRAG